jgi:hypothetical protein
MIHRVSGSVSTRRARWGPCWLRTRAIGVGAGLAVAALLLGCTAATHDATRLDPVPVARSTPPTAPATLTTVASVRAQVVAAANRFAVLARQCATRPAKPCDLSDVAGPPEVVAFAQKMAGLATHGLKVRLMPASRLAIGSVSVDDPTAQATVAVCQVDADVVYTPAAGPSGQDVVYNNAVNSYHNTWVFHLDPSGGTHWKLYSDTRTSESVGATCASAG